MLALHFKKIEKFENKKEQIKNKIYRGQSFKEENLLCENGAIQCLVALDAVAVISCMEWIGNFLFSSIWLNALQSNKMVGMVLPNSIRSFKKHKTTQW